MNLTNKPWRIILLLLVIGMVSAVSLRFWLHPPLQLQSAQLLPVAKSVTGYALTFDKTKINLSSLEGHWVLIFFGYTACPDVCPLELQKLGQMLKQFDDSAAKSKPLVIFVSVDPERDTPDVLNDYTRYFHPEIIGLTGTNSELAALTDFFGASYNRTTTIAGKEYLIQAGADMPPESEKHYLVNHSTRIFIIDPQSRYTGSFAPPHDTAILVSDMEQLFRR